MKKIILLLALFAGLIANAQDCPGDHVDFLKGRRVKVLPLAENLQSLGYKGFYSDADLKNIFRRVGKASDYKALAGKEFKVVSYELYKIGTAEKNFRLVLENPLKERVYYDYNPDDCSSFPFELIPEPEPYVEPCSTFEARTSSDGLRYYESKPAEGITFVRFYAESGIVDAVEMNTTSVPQIQNKAAIWLNNNEKIEGKDVDVRPIPNEYRPSYYRALVFLTEKDSELLKNSEIVKVTIGDIDRRITKGALLKAYFNCMLNKEPLVSENPIYNPVDCSMFDTSFDKDRGEITYRMPEIDGVIISRTTDVDKNTVYIGTIRISSETMQIGKGVMIRFEDDHLLNYPDANLIERKIPGGDYLYAAVFVIKDADLGHFAKSRIKGVKVIDAVKPITRGNHIKKMVNCLMEKLKD